MNAPETINIEKYAEALNNLVGMDIGYLCESDEDVNTIVELIRAAKALENRVKELEADNKKWQERLDREAKCQYDLAGKIVDLKEEINILKSEAEWIEQEPWDPREATTWKCSKCKHIVRDKTKHCANCGSKMKGVK